MRYIWLAAGWLALALGVAGIYLPLLPTTPFLLLASFCFSKGSERWHVWLHGHPWFGPPIKQWHEYGAIAPKVKLLAVCFIVFSLALGFLYNLPWYLLLVQASVLGGVSFFILTRPNPPESKA